MKLLDVALDHKLGFGPHISNICKKAATQLNVLKRLKSFIGYRRKKFLFRALYIRTSSTVLWLGISHHPNLLFRTSKSYKNML